MKIKELKVNAFGGLENKEMQFADHINIIQGKNESGKSTLLKFITDMFYGISKNKRGKEISDYEKYEPWGTEEFSGKLVYSLENGNQYEIYRDFRKKNPKLYDEEGNDIAKEYTIDKNNGSQFFMEQTQIEEEMFLSTLVAEQQEVRISRQSQNVLVQKIANLAGTGEDSVSYKKAMDKINRKQIEEIGTTRSQGRPLNIVEEELEKLKKEKENFACYKDKQYEIEKSENELKEEIEKQEIKIELLHAIKKNEEKIKLEKEKIQFHEKIKKENEEKIQQLNFEKNKLEEKIINKKTEKEDLKNNNNKNNEKIQDKKINMILIGILFFMIGIYFLNSIILKNNIFKFLLGIIILLNLIAILWINIKKNKQKNKLKQKKKEEEEKQKKENEIYFLEINKINSQIELLQKNTIEQNNEIKKINEKINLEIYLEKEKLQKKYKEKINENEINYFLNLENVFLELENIQNQYQNNQLKLHQFTLDKNSILPKLEKLSSLEEKIELLKEQKTILLKDNQSIELVKEVLEIAYQKMKENVTPKFTKNLSETIAQIAEGKYQKVKVNDEEGLLVEKEDGEYIPANRLSVGTVDQLYISLRFSMIKELAKENMPILLDEAFAYYDNARLENILEYIHTQFPETQIMIFTCTNREKEILDKKQIPYQLSIL